MKYATINQQSFDFAQYKNWQLTPDQFGQLQSSISGANMPLDGSIENLNNWLEFRDSYLVECENEDGHQSYAWCRFGSFEENNCTVWWYETTSGTILSVANKGYEVFFGVSLPLDRAEPERTHYREIQYILAGRTSEQQKNWYSCLYQPETRQYYTEFARFHNQHLVEHGFKPYPLLWEQYNALCTLESLSKVAVHRDGSIFSGDVSTIRTRLREAAQQWDNLFPVEEL